MTSDSPDSTSALRASLQRALSFSGTISGSTHQFYHYPARFAPEVVRAVLHAFSAPDDLVLDCFLGGGTTAVESLAMGRRVLGVDINSLAHFVATVRTTPLTEADEKQVILWSEAVHGALRHADLSWISAPCVVNLPRPLELVLSGALAMVDELPRYRQRYFARTVLLRLGQWALEAREGGVLSREGLVDRLPVLVTEMLSGLREFVAACEASGVAPNEIESRRVLLHRDTVGLEREPTVAFALRQVRLVLTSPPYPGVHVLYHRWQHMGRRETPAPYWVAAAEDGRGESYYTMGSRTPTGLQRYYRTLHAAFTSVRPFLAPDAVVVQIVAFPNVREHLPRYLSAMDGAGYVEDEAFARERLWRAVPNRRWYQRVKGTTTESGSEVLLVHRVGARFP